MRSGIRAVWRPRSRVACLAFLGALAGAWVGGGCGGAAGDNLPRQAVSGTVTLDGAPVSHGFIQFRPTTEGPTTEVGGEIKDGKYEIAREQGPVPGGYR